MLYLMEFIYDGIWASQLICGSLCNEGHTRSVPGSLDSGIFDNAR